MPKRRWGISKTGKKRILSTVLAMAMVVASIPARELINGVTHVEARATYEPVKLGVSLMCADMLKSEYADDVYTNIVRTKSQAEDSKNGSPFNNVGMFGTTGDKLTYDNKHGDAGKAYWTDVKTDYSALYNLAKKGQIQQSICANANNHKHRSTANHWGEIKQYNKIILGYPTDEKNNMFYCAHLLETDEYGGGICTVGGNDSWSTMKPDKGYKNREAVYLTAKKGCDTCSGAYIEKVSVAFKDTTAPYITSVKISTDPDKDPASDAVQYFNGGNTIYIRMKFSEYVRLADNLNTDASYQSSKIKLGLSLSSSKTKELDAKIVYADLYSLKGDTAVFSYSIPYTLNNQRMDYYIERIADIRYQGALISKTKTFNRVFLDNNGKTLFDTSSTTLAALKSAVGEDVYNTELKRTTSAITDIAGNPLDIDKFRDDTVKKLGPMINKTYLDTANPKVSTVSLAAKPESTTNPETTTKPVNDNADNYLKAGTVLTSKVVINEKVKKLSSEELGQIKAVYNIYRDGNKFNYVTVKATGMEVDDEKKITTVTFEDLTVTKDMNVNPINTGSFTNEKDYKITFKDINNINLLKDYADNVCISPTDLRGDTEKLYFLDNQAPTIKVNNTQVTGSNYEMTPIMKNSNNNSKEVDYYCINLSAIDEDTISGDTTIHPYASGVIGGKGSVSIDFLTNEDLEFQYVLSKVPLSKEDLEKKYMTGMTVSNNILIPDLDTRTAAQSEPIEFDLAANESYVYLYLKFIDNINYENLKNGIKVTFNATDINGNTATSDVYYNYDPKDIVKPRITYTKKELKKNDSGSYQQVKVYFNDLKSGVVRDDIRYIWVEEGEEVPDISEYNIVPLDNIYDSYSYEPADRYCRAVIDSPLVKFNETYKGSLYMYIRDKAGNETITPALTKVDIDMTMPALQITVQGGADNEESSTAVTGSAVAVTSSSLVVNGPFTTSDQSIGMFVAIEDPGAPGNYFMKKENGTASGIADSYNGRDLLDSATHVFNNDCMETLGGWTYITLEKEGSIYSVNWGDWSSRGLITTDERGARLLAIASDNYYGEVNVIAGTGFMDSAFSAWDGNGFKFDASKGSLITDSYVMVTDTYALSDKLSIDRFYSNVTTKGNPVSVKLTPQGNYGVQSDTSVDGYNPENNGAEYLSDIGGARFKVNINNSATDIYALHCIDFKSRDTYLRLKNVDSGNIVYEWDLAKLIAAKKASQENSLEYGVPGEVDIEIPEELVLENGHYAVELSVRNHLSEGMAEGDKIAKASCDDIYVYDYSAMMTEAFGIDSVTTKIGFSVNDEYENDTHPPYYGYKKTGSYDFSRKVVDERVKDYSSDSESAYDTDTLYIGNFTSDADSSEGTITYNKTIKMSVNGMNQEDLDNYWIKVWTGGAEGKQAAKWYKFTSFGEENKTMSINVKPVDALSEGGSKNPELLLAEGSNTVSYQLMNIGGNKSGVHELEIMHNNASPRLGLDVEKTDEVVSSLDARVSQLDSDLIVKDVILYESKFDGNEANADVVKDMEFTYTENGRHLFYAIDGYGNLAFKQLYVTDIDNMAPTAEFEYANPAVYYDYDEAAPGDGYIVEPSLKAVILDDKALDDAKVHITLDDNETYELYLSPDEIHYGEYYNMANVERDRLKDTGMRSIFVRFSKQEDGLHKLELEIYIEPDIDKQKPFKERIDHVLNINVTDSTGKSLENVLTTDSEEYDYYGLNNEIKLRKAIMKTEKAYMTLEFSGDVKVTKVNGNEVPEELRSEYYPDFEINASDRYEYIDAEVAYGKLNVKDYFGICKDGTYEVEYEDVFGNQYVDEFEVKDFFGEYSADIQYSTVEMTNQNVVATITGTDDDAEISLADESAAESDKYTITWNKDKSKATIDFTENASVKFLLKVKGAVEEDKTAEYNVTVGNIDKTAPDDVQVTWVFKEDGHIYYGNELDVSKLAKLTTNDDIEVYISSPSEEIHGINDKGLNYTFSYSEDMDRSYTFEYADECGNVGSPITVTLPDELIMTEYEEPVPEEGFVAAEDTEAPSIAADVYGVYDGIAEYKTSWNADSEDFADIAEEVGYIAGYKIKYSLIDSSKAKIVVLDGLNAALDDVTYESSSQSIEGVKVSEVDNTLIITKECAITVVAIDSKGNKSSHSISASKFDTEKPIALVKKVGKSFTSMRLQFYMTDNTDPNNANGTVVPVTSDMKIGMDEMGKYYYRDVYDNGTYNITFKDKCGNRSTISTDVTEIDNEAPKMKVLSWSPCYEKDGTVYEDLPPNKTVNSSVTLLLDFNKTVSKLQVFYKDGEDWIEDSGSFSTAAIDLGGRSGKVVFDKPVPGIIKVVATSPNGISNEISDIDLVGKIDKAAPEITSTKTEENNTVKVIYKADEKVLVTGCDYDTTYGANTNIPLTIKKNGTYELTFTDMAGNITTKSITVDTIDETTPDVYAAGIPQEYVSPDNCKIKVTMSEKGTITFQGKEYSIKAPVDSDGDGKLVGDELDWITLPINANGTYQVLARDEAGLTSIKKLEVKMVDDTAPYIEFYKSSITVSAGATKAELEELLLDESGYSLWDNIDTNPKITFENMLTEDNLSNQGIHEVTYVVTDSVGNKRKATRYVKVISSANLILKANGELMVPCDSTILSDNNVEIVLEKSRRKGESFKIYYKEGIRKAGSLKNAKVSKDGKLTNLESGFYTLYIVTQNKETYLTYLYINK